MSINNDWYVEQHPLFLIVRRKRCSSTIEFLLFPRIPDCIQMQIRSLRAGLFRETWNNYSPFYYKFQVLIQVFHSRFPWMRASDLFILPLLIPSANGGNADAERRTKGLIECFAFITPDTTYSFTTVYRIISRLNDSLDNGGGVSRRIRENKHL